MALTSTTATISTTALTLTSAITTTMAITTTLTEISAESTTFPIKIELNLQGGFLLTKRSKVFANLGISRTSNLRLKKLTYN
jgi:hypothetical protein